MSKRRDIEEGAVEMRLLTMRELVEITGVPRSTIQFYVRQDLLPPPQRLSNNRLIYGRVHVDLLQQIRRLKTEGLSLDQMRPLLRETASSSTFYDVDVAQAVDSATKARILEAAAEQFGRKGYRRTRLSDVMRQAGVSPQVLTSHFASKKQLFAESFGIASRKVADRAVPAMEREPDLTRKLLAGFGKLLRSQQVPDPTLWALARAEALYEGGEPAAMAQETYRKMSSLYASELAGLRANNEEKDHAVEDDRSEASWPPVSDELMAYCFLGAEEYLTMRLAWDDEFSREDALKAYLLLIAAVHAQYDVDLDVHGRWASYLEAIRALLGAKREATRGIATPGDDR